MKTQSNKRAKSFLGACVAILVFAMHGHAAVLYDFDDGLQGWGGFGGLGVIADAGSLLGTFNPAPAPSPPPSGAFGSPLMGSTLNDVNPDGLLGVSQISFDFSPITFLPTSLFINFGNDDDGYITASISLSGFTLNTFNPVVISSANFIGATANMLSIVQNMSTVFDLGITAGNSTESQQFRLDNFEITLATFDLGPLSAIPEPGAVQLILFTLVLGMTVRRQIRLQYRESRAGI